MITTRPQKVSDRVLKRFFSLIAPVSEWIDLIVLFGSRARGDARHSSDYDLLVIVPQNDERLMASLYEAVVDVNIETGKLVSLQVFTRAEYERLKAMPTTFIQVVHEEGIVLWAKPPAKGRKRIGEKGKNA